ncbi:MAG: type II toxin-antitoxin system HicA family toxin [Deltaproteobacteria bacterium]|nr:type II toxin-antitoxin system HicA family toxin [Deltaproteobacteria bacterium]
MSRKEKLLERLQRRPKDFTWDELTSLLKILGNTQRKTGKTGGSRMRFVHPVAPTITLHKPHPDNIIKEYVINDILEYFKKEGMI